MTKKFLVVIGLCLVAGFTQGSSPIMGVSSSTPPTGTGFYHTTSGVMDAASVNIVQAPAFTALTDAATVTITCDATKAIQNAKVTLGGNRTLAISGAADGMTGVLIVTQDGTGSRTLALPAGSKVIAGGSGAVTLTTTAAAVDVLTWVYNGSFIWTIGKNFN